MANSNTDAPGGELIITTPGMDYQVPANSNATVVFLGEHDFERNVIAQIQAYVETHGTLKSLTIVGHGTTLLVSTQRDTRGHPDEDLNFGAFFHELEGLQSKLGTKITDRLVFDSCSTMKGLPATVVDALSNYAQRIDTDIIGATTNIKFAPNGTGKTIPQYGLMVRFGRDGTIHRDETINTGSIADVEKAIFTNNGHPSLATQIVTSLELSQYITGKSSIDRLIANEVPTILSQLQETEKKESPWFACYEGKTQAEGDACMLPKERADSRDMSSVRQAGQADEGRAGGAVAADPVAVKPKTPLPSL